MPEFVYTWIEPRTGREQQGAISGETQEQALAELRQRAVALTSLAPRVVVAPVMRVVAPAEVTARVWRLARFWTNRGETGGKALAAFTRQLAILVSAGMPVHRALEVLARAEPRPAFQRNLRGLAEIITQGGTLSDGLAAQPRSFGPLYRHMVKAGEAAGALGPVLERLASFLERSDRVRGRVKAAMVYPLIILALAGTIVAVLVVVVVPKFEGIFHGLLRGQPLPGLTQALLAVSGYAGRHLLAGVLLVGIGGAALRKGLGTERGGAQRDRLVLRLPVLGDFLLKAAVGRLTRTLGALLASGVPILEALLIAKDGSGNRVVAAAITRVHARVKEGAPLAVALVETGRFPQLVTSMVEVGEETGGLPAMLTRIAEVYEEGVDTAISALTSVIEPALIVVMALFVGFIVVALFLPIVGVIEHLQ